METELPRRPLTSEEIKAINATKLTWMDSWKIIWHSIQVVWVLISFLLFRKETKLVRFDVTTGRCKFQTVTFLFRRLPVWKKTTYVP